MIQACMYVMVICKIVFYFPFRLDCKPLEDRELPLLRYLIKGLVYSKHSIHNCQIEF